MFHIGLRRNFLDAFISTLTPTIVVAIILFALLLLSGQIDYGRARSILVGMFLVIVFAHIDARRRLVTEQIFYLEYFYILTCVGILWVAFQCIRKPQGMDWSVFRFRDNLAVHVLYWPVIAGVLFAVTIRTFV